MTSGRCSLIGVDGVVEVEARSPPRSPRTCGPTRCLVRSSRSSRRAARDGRPGFPIADEDLGVLCRAAGHRRRRARSPVSPTQYTLLEVAPRDRPRPGAARACADPPLLRLRARRPADQRAAGVPRRRGPRAGRHRRALPHPPRPARGPAREAARQRRQHPCSRRSSPVTSASAAGCGSARARTSPAAATSRASWPTRWRR